MQDSERIDINIVLDRSGSMEAVREQAVGSFNAFLTDQRSEPGAAALTLAQFDDEYDIVYDAAPLVDVPDLTQQRYQPRGCTALLDAIGQTIRRTDTRLLALADGEPQPRVLVVVITDGMENASREFDSRTLFDLVHDRQDRGWKFVFLGANQDAIATASQYGIARESAMSIRADKAGVVCAMSSVNSAVKRHRRKSVAKHASFFTDAERAANNPRRERPQ